MDEFEKQLKRDAELIRAEPSNELQVRIDASLRTAREMGSSAPEPSKRPLAQSTREMASAPEPSSRPLAQTTSFWSISSITGLVAAALVLVLMERFNDEPVVPVEATADVDEPELSSGIPEEWLVGEFPLKLRSADLTWSLEQELLDLQSDLERARKNVEEDVKNSF
jgi:hypothetical protein